MLFTIINSKVSLRVWICQLSCSFTESIRLRTLYIHKNNRLLCKNEPIIYSRCLQVQQHQDSHTNSLIGVINHTEWSFFVIENLDDAASAINDFSRSILIYTVSYIWILDPFFLKILIIFCFNMILDRLSCSSQNLSVVRF